MADNRQRVSRKGLSSKQELTPDYIVRDTRTMGMKFSDFLSNPLNITTVLGAMAIATLFYPHAPGFMLFTAWLLYRHGRRKATTIRLPIRLPQTSGIVDYSDLQPGSKKAVKGRGIYFLGNEVLTNKEIWATNEDMRTHILIMGTTGAGKTATLSSMTLNALVQGSGYIYVDGKADISLFARLYSMARMMGREDDMLIISFMTGARDIIGRQADLISNTMNFFTFGSSSMISQNLVSLLDGGGGSNGDMWKGRSISFIEALSRGLVHMRDNYNMPLSIDVFRSFFDLKKLEEFTWDARHEYKMPKEEWVVFKPLENYLMNVPGYTLDKKGKQVQDTLQQHGFITMQLTRATGSLADTYGHVVNATYGEVDFYDVVINRRLLLVMLPALEKAPAELANLGKIVISNLRATLASTLGSKLEGSRKEIIENRQTEAKTPFLCILDEYGYYAVEGFAVVAAQARSLGFSVVFAGQDYPAFKKAGEEEAASIIGNCNIKMCMKLEDPKETFALFKETAGDAYVTHSSGFTSQPGTVANNYMDMMNASIERRSRIELADLKEQMEGEAHFFFKSSIIRGDTFFADCPLADEYQANGFVMVGVPSPSDIEDHLDDPEERLREINTVLVKLTQKPTASIRYRPQWGLIEDHIDRNPAFSRRNPTDTIICEAILLADAFNGKPIADTVGDAGDEGDKGGKGQATQKVKPRSIEEIDPVMAAVSGKIVDYAGYDDAPEYLAPVSVVESVIDEQETVESLTQIELLATETGKEDVEEAESVAKGVVNDMGNGAVYTRYPPTVDKGKAVDLVSTALSALSDLVDTNSGKGEN